MAGHRVEDPLRLVDAPAERHHDADVGQAHVLAHAPQRRAFEREAGGIGRVRIARGAAEAEHRVFFLRLEALAAEQPRVFVGLEVGQPDDHRLGIEGRRDRADAFGQLLDEVIGRPWHSRATSRAIAWRACAEATFSGLTSAIGWTLMCSLMMNSMRARPTPSLGSIGRVERQLRIAEIQHDRGARPRQLAQHRPARS